MLQHSGQKPEPLDDEPIPKVKIGALYGIRRRDPLTFSFPRTLDPDELDWWQPTTNMQDQRRQAVAIAGGLDSEPAPPPRPFTLSGLFQRFTRLFTDPK